MEVPCFKWLLLPKVPNTNHCINNSVKRNRVDNFEHYCLSWHLSHPCFDQAKEDRLSRWSLHLSSGFGKKEEKTGCLGWSLQCQDYPAAEHGEGETSSIHIPCQTGILKDHPHHMGNTWLLSCCPGKKCWRSQTTVLCCVCITGLPDPQEGVALQITICCIDGLDRKRKIKSWKLGVRNMRRLW